MSYLFKKGTTNVSIELYIVDSGDGTPETGVVFDTSGIDLYYRRDAAAVVTITEADLATPALTDAHADGGFLHIQDGFYRLDLPDAACATGVNKVVVGGTVTGMVVMPVVIQLVDYDPFDTVRLGLTALPNAAADAGGGLPISDAGGLDLDGMNTNVNDIESDTNELQVDDVPGLIAALNDISTANVNAEVLDVHNTDTITLPGQIAPPLTPTLRELLGWLYKAFRNRKDETSTLWQLYADNETTVDAKATTSDDATTAIKQEIVSGP